MIEELKIILSWEFVEEFFTVVSNFTSFALSLASLIAIMAGGYWFYMRGSKKPRAQLEHSVYFRRLRRQRYVAVSVRMNNVGNVPLCIEPSKDVSAPSLVMIEEVAPSLNKSREYQNNSPEFKLDLLGYRFFPVGAVVEPGEDQVFLFEFLIQAKNEVIKIYTHVDNSRYNKNKGWNLTTVHEVKE